MCFLYDDAAYDWVPQSIDREDRVSNGNVRCDDCGRRIPQGQTYRHTHLQQYEECRSCEEGECSCCSTDSCCQCERPDFGESDATRQCQECLKFREAIRALEKEEGCDPYESEPAVTDLLDGLTGTDEPEKYIARAARDHPELETSGYLTYISSRVLPEEK